MKNFRDEIALMAAEVFLESLSTVNSDLLKDVAEKAYEFADCMIAASEKKQ